MNPFDLPGPQFLALYAVVVLAGVVVAVILRRRARAPSDTVSEDPPLHPYEIAHLSGGATACVNAAIARLVDAKVLALDETGEMLARTGTTFEATHPMESLILGTAGVNFKVKDARAAAASEVSRIREHLHELGLEMADDKRRAAGYLPALVLGFIVILGFVKIIVGIVRERPVMFLGIDLAFLVFAIVITLVIRPFRTIRGDRYLDRLKFRHAALKTAASKAPATLQGTDLSLAVGLFGLGVLAGGPLLPLRKMLTPPRGGGGGGGGDYGGGCGGGCGGGARVAVVAAVGVAVAADAAAVAEEVAIEPDPLARNGHRLETRVGAGDRPPARIGLRRTGRRGLHGLYSAGRH